MNDRYLVAENDVITNVIIWSGDPYSPGPNTSLLPCEKYPGVDIGWILVDGVWTPPNEPESNPEVAPS